MSQRELAPGDLVRVGRGRYLEAQGGLYVDGDVGCVVEVMYPDDGPLIVSTVSVLIGGSLILFLPEHLEVMDA